MFIDPTKMTENSDMLSDYPYLLEDIKAGDTIAIESGLMDVLVKEVHTQYLSVTALSECTIGSRRHMNFPGISLRLPGLTDKDKADILFGIENGVHYIAASFIRTPENVQEIKEFLKQHNAEHIQIISKIENQEGIENIEEIVKVSNAIMIARGDLGIEIPIHELPYYQKYILDACFKYGRPCIMATELLKSMVNSPFPTRAEVSDVYNSVIARVDAVMLSDETAIGKYPIESVELMRETVEEAEKHTVNKHKDFDTQQDDEISSGKKLLVKHALFLADELQTKYVIVFTHSGNLAKMVAGFKPNQQVFAFTANEDVYDSLRILFSIHGMQFKKRANHTTENQENAMKVLLEKNLIKEGDKIVIIADKKRGSETDPLIRVTTVR
jgi:pyruvate kinase